LFQFRSSSKAEYPVRTGILPGFQSPSTEESLFQFRVSSKTEWIFKETNPSNTQATFLQKPAFQFAGLPETTKAHQVKHTDLPPTKAPLFQSEGTHKCETPVKEMYNCTAYPVCPAGVSFAFEPTKNPDQISQTMSLSGTEHGVNSESRHNEAPVQATNTDKGSLSSGEIPLSLVPALETGELRTS
jgi:hypothetical protein